MTPTEKTTIVPKPREAKSAPAADIDLNLEQEPASSHFMARLRGYFLTGLIVVGPVAVTIYVVWWFINMVDAWVKPLVPQTYLPDTYLPFRVPGVGLIVGILGLMVVGALTANLFGRTIVSYGEMMLDRMPVVRGVYRLVKQIFTTIFSKSGTSFKRVGLIEFPRRGLYALVFLAGDPPQEVDEKIGGGNPLITVFMPNGPNPTTGFIVFMPANEVIPLDLPVEDAAKLIVSAGLVGPDRQQEELRKLARSKSGKPVQEEEPVV
ncbi:DUF502 domain-containing protein [Methyloceanibacter sp.]|uniref:DUF502 domain-containing protein n=1 Tax=Methyloceanibacter sp. TaxID=1965321 RepID=UPI002D48CAF8|nr:DUF502 domain-containing protein [Methyloceanibacter sp.]HZP10544.1 DUF502 domain-containing protein [Methyloceanibacter sp.]